MALENVAAKYFSNLNPIATRIYQDLEETKSDYEELWSKLSQEEQDQILTESIIKPEVSVKYRPPEVTKEAEFAVKIVVDDHCSYRDEHSGPFSFRTRSQRNLNVFHEKTQKKSDEKIRFKSAVPKVSNVPIYAQQVDLAASYDPKADDDMSSNCSTLPKTGLDFLDNW